MILPVVKHSSVSVKSRQTVLAFYVCKKFMNLLTRLVGHTTSLLLVALLFGSGLGVLSPETGKSLNQSIDPSILFLVFLLLFEVPLKGVLKGATNLRFISLAWAINFLVVPLIGFGVASIFLSGNGLLYTGLIIYFMAPCTDWYLGFTRLAKGNVELGAALLPINMLTQLALFPVYLLAFDTTLAYKVDLSVLLEWFLQPLAAAVILRIALHCIAPEQLIKTFLPICRFCIPIVLTLLVAQIFAANINQLIEYLTIVPLLLVAIFTFFLVTYLLSEIVAKLVHLKYPEHCLLAFTTGARNAPLMLGLATVASPDQPLIYAGITIGMLIEFPHLAALKALFLTRLNLRRVDQSKPTKLDYT